MVTANQSVPQIFFGGFNALSSHSGANATTIAAVTPETAFTIGSFLANFDTQQTAVLNVIFLSQLGSPATVSASGLVGPGQHLRQRQPAHHRLGGVLNGGNVYTTSLSANQWLSIWQTAVASQVSGSNCAASPTPSVCVAGTALTGLSFSGSNSVQLCQLVSIDGTSCEAVC